MPIRMPEIRTKNATTVESAARAHDGGGSSQGARPYPARLGKHGGLRCEEAEAVPTSGGDVMQELTHEEMTKLWQEGKVYQEGQDGKPRNINGETVAEAFIRRGSDPTRHVLRTRNNLNGTTPRKRPRP